MAKNYYSPSTGGFYIDSFHGESIPKDSVKITSDEKKYLLNSLYSGKSISVDANGGLVVLEKPKSEILEVVKEELRGIRRDILDAVTGIGFRANVAGNDFLAQEAVLVSQKLLDITDDPVLNSAKTREEMRNSGMSAFVRIAESCSVDIKSAFKHLEL